MIRTRWILTTRHDAGGVGRFLPAVSSDWRDVIYKGTDDIYYLDGARRIIQHAGDRGHILAQAR